MAKSTTPRTTTPRKPRAAKTASMPLPRLVTRPMPDAAAIAVRAYELFLASGSVHGYDMAHWLQAERELTEGRLTSAA